MKKTEEIISIINHFLVEEFEVDEGKISPEGDLKQILDLDSLDYIDLVVVIENNFHFKVKPEDFNDLKTFGDFYRYIDSHIKK